MLRSPDVDWHHKFNALNLALLFLNYTCIGYSTLDYDIKYSPKLTVDEISTCAEKPEDFTRKSPDESKTEEDLELKCTPNSPEVDEVECTGRLCS